MKNQFDPLRLDEILVKGLALTRAHGLNRMQMEVDSNMYCLLYKGDDDEQTS